MKITPSRYVLAAEILIIFCFHLVKIKQTEKKPADPILNQTVKIMPVHKPVTDNKSGFEYMLVNLIK